MGEDATPLTQTPLQAAHELTSSGHVSELKNREDYCLYITQIHYWKKIRRGEVNKGRETGLFP